jgi:hypothetical protein
MANRILHSLLFSDDPIIFAQDEEDVRKNYMIKKLTEEYKNCDYTIGLNKTAYRAWEQVGYLDI